MSDSLSNHSEEVKVWSRIMADRKAEWTKLAPEVLVAIVQEPWGKEESAPAMNHPHQKLEWLLNTHFRRSIDRSINPFERRSSWSCMNALLKKIDEEIGKNVSNTEIDNRDNTTMNTEKGASNKNRNEVTRNNASSSNHIASSASTQNSNFGARQPPRASSSNHATRDTSAIGQKSISDQNRTSLSAQTSSEAIRPSPGTGTTVLSPSASIRRTGPVNGNHQALSSAFQPIGQRATLQDNTNVPGAQDNSLPKRQLASEPTDGARSDKSRNMGLSLSTSAQVAALPSKAPQKSNGSHQRVPNGVHAISHRSSASVPSPEQFLPTSQKPVWIWFRADEDGKFAGSQKGRSTLRAGFHPRTPTPYLLKQVCERFARWDPYWRMDQVDGIESTHKIFKVEKQTKGTPPLRALEYAFTLAPNVANKIQSWGKPSTINATEGEMRLLLRMLPLTPPATMALKGKKPRADTHLWPKGSYIQLNGNPVNIIQRRQQSHDESQWYTMSKTLDLTPLVTQPGKSNKIQVYTLDEQPYVMCVAVCQYQPPSVLFNKVLNEWVEKLSHEKALEKALKIASQQTIVLEDAGRVDELSSFIFPLTCPVSMTIIVTPVRGRQCTHWQCFDLQNFLDSNSHVTGTRFECPVCRNILSCRDLQLCGLTQTLLKEYKGELRAHRDRIQFFSNGTWKLLGESRKRYASKRDDGADNGGNATKKSRQDPNDVIELL